MRERSGAPSLFELLAIASARIDRAHKKKPRLHKKERGADISEPREGSSLDGYLAKLTISAAVTNVTGVPFIIWTWTGRTNSGPGDIKRAAHGYEPTREAAMVAFASMQSR